MATAADIFLKLAEMLLGRRDLSKIRRRDEVDRVANYFDRISTCLLEAAKNFEDKKDAWEQIGEVRQHLEGFLMIAKPVLDDQVVQELKLWLDISYEMDVFVTSLSTRKQLPLDQTMDAAALEEYRVLQAVDRERRIFVETAKIKQISGLFKAMASQLRAASSDERPSHKG